MYTRVLANVDSKPCRALQHMGSNLHAIMYGHPVVAELLHLYQFALQLPLGLVLLLPVQCSASLNRSSTYVGPSCCQMALYGLLQYQLVSLCTVTKHYSSIDQFTVNCRQ